MDIGRWCFGDVLLVMVLVCLHRGIAGLEDDYDDTPSFGRCPWIRNKLKNGRVKLRYRGRVAKFICDSGYELAGKRSSTCVRGQWNNPIPVCVARGCSRVPPVPNGRVTEMYRGALLVYDCNPGYTIDGETSIHCDGRRWSAPPPACVIASENPETFCDFESSDLCGWSQDPTHDFDWFRNQHSTPSGHVGTGPSYDHTFGENKGGFYLYIEASSPRKINDTARLFSPVYPADLSGGCFLFWYHMYGAATGGIRVYLKPESHVFDELTPRWQKYGDQGNQWLRGHMIVPTLHENFQIVIEGVRGESYVGDSAIDDVRLSSNICEDIDDAVYNTESTVEDSCRGRCQEAEPGTSCGCNDNCFTATYSNCCHDYLAICGAGNYTVVLNTDEPSPFDHTSKTASPITPATSISTIENMEGISVAIQKTTQNSKELNGTTLMDKSTTVLQHVSSTPVVDSTTISAANTQTASTVYVSSTDSKINTEQASTFKSTMAPLVTTPSLISTAENTIVPLTTISRIAPVSSSTTISTSTTILKSATTETTTLRTKIPIETSPLTTPFPLTTTSIISLPSTTSFPSTSTKYIQTETRAPETTQTTQEKSSVTTALPTSDELTTLQVSSSTAVGAATIVTTSSPLPSSQSSTTAISSTPTTAAAITPLSSTRRTYNLRPRTKVTTPFSNTDYTITPRAEGMKTFSSTSTSEVTTPSETTTSRYRYYTRASQRVTKAESTISSGLTSTAKTLFAIAVTKQTTFRDIPQTTKFTYRAVKSTQAPLPNQSGTFESNSSKAESVGGKGSTAAVISIVAIVLICVAGAGVFYVRRQKNKRQSKLSDDSEMRFLPESDYMEYSDASALDKIMSR